MANSSVAYRSPYAGSVALMVTRQSKSMAVGPALANRLQMSVLEYVASSSCSRTGPISPTAVELIRHTARFRAEECVKRFARIVPYVIASAGGLVPHPVLPGCLCELEVLYFIDARRQLQLEVYEATQEHTFRRATVHSWDAVACFADNAGFPAQAITLHPATLSGDGEVFDRITTIAQLRRAFQTALSRSPERAVVVATDFRAQFNPRRMRVIRSLAERMATRLATECPACGTPGWGPISLVQKFPQSYHLHQIEAYNCHVLGCTKCQYAEQRGGSPHPMPHHVVAQR